MIRTRCGIGKGSAGFAVLAAAMVGIVLSPVLGTEILRNSTVLVSDNFNTTAVGGNDTLGNQPHADVGAWISDDGTLNDYISNSGAQGVEEGDACLRLDHDGSNGAQLKATFPLVTTVGDTVTWRSRVYFTSGGGDDDYQFSMRTTGSGSFPDDFVVLCTIRSGVVNAYNGSAYVPTGTTIVMDQWTTWEISYTRGASTFSWLVNGAGDSAAPTLPGASGRDIGFAMFFGNGSSHGHPVYLDAPSTGAPPPNDNCANAYTATAGVYGGSTALATVDGTASCGTSNGSPDVWYKVTPTYSGTLGISTCGSGFDTVASIYSGCGGAELGCNDNCSGTPCGGTDSCLGVAVTGGSTYFIRVSGVSGATGHYVLNISVPPPPPPANDLCSAAIVITDGTYTGGTGTALNDGSNACGGTLGPDVWYAYSAPVDSVLNADLCGSSYDTVLSVHTGCPGNAGNAIACNDDCSSVPGGACNSSRSCITTNITGGVTYYLRVTGWNGGTGNYTLHVSHIPLAPPPPNDACGSAIAIGNGTVTGSTNWATNDGDAPCGSSGTAADAWYAYTATCNGVLSADTCGSTYNTVLSVHSACPGTVGNTLACNDDCSGTATSCLQVPVTSGLTYLIRVSGSSGARGDFTLHTSCGPAITTPSLPLVQSFETDAVGSTGGWETAPSLAISPPSVCTVPPPVEVIATDPSPASGGTHSLHWFEPSGSPRSAVVRRWVAPASSTTAVMKVNYDFKIVQQTNHALIPVVSGFNGSGVLNLNVYSVRFDSTTDDGLPIGWNYLDNGNWNNFIPITDTNQVIGHWFHYYAIINVGTHLVDLTITPLDVGGAGGHIIGSFQGGNPLDADVANYTGVFIFQSNIAATSELILDNLKVEIVGQEACNTPWADADGDGDVDMNDFAVFQRCFTGAATGLLPGCNCFDRNANSAVGTDDFNKFKLCGSGAGVPANPLCAP